MAVITTPESLATTSAPVSPRHLEWSPVILGTLGATAISVVLLTFGAALGLSAVSPHPYAGLSVRATTILTGTYTALVAVAAFAAGGYLAGRLRTPWKAGEEAEQHFRDGAHGFAVWALGVVVAAALAAAGAASFVKAAAQTTTAVATAGVAGAISNSDPSRLAMAPIDFAVDRLLAPAPAPAPTPTQVEMAGTGLTARSDLAEPMARAFIVSLRTGQLDARDRTNLSQVIMQQTGMAKTDAEQRVDQAFAELKSAEQTARDTADAARKATLIAAFATAATLAVGCAAACAGAALGARHRDENTLVSLFGSRRFW
jgi:hypothetical protein